MQSTASEKSSVCSTSACRPTNTANRGLFLEKVRASSEAVQNGDYAHAVELYTDALALDPTNHILYTNRAAAYTKLGLYKKAEVDSKTARELNPKWIKVRACWMGAEMEMTPCCTCCIVSGKENSNDKTCYSCMQTHLLHATCWMHRYWMYVFWNPHKMCTV